jgi:hypothetical protein
MRSHNARRDALIRDIADLTSPTRDVSLAALERMARTERAYVMGEFLADGIIWLFRLPRRVAEWALPHPINRGS